MAGIRIVWLMLATSLTATKRMETTHGPVTLNLDPPKMDPLELIFQKYMDPLELIFQ